MSENERVGYKRPPKSTQFRPGESGNPAGRPKKTKNLIATLGEELNCTVTLRENGQQTTVSKKEAVVRDLLRQAIGGNLRAHGIIFSLCVRETLKDDNPSTDQLSPEDLDVLQNFPTRDAQDRVQIRPTNKPRKD